MNAKSEEQNFDSQGYRSLLAAVERDEERSKGFHDYRGKLAWAVERARHYAERTGLSATEILDAWERDRNYWYMNYYQESNQPEIGAGRVRVFDTIGEFLESIGERAFRCPSCGGVSSDPYTCNADPDSCDWKAYGFLRTLGKGACVYVKEKLRGEEIFMPIAWEGGGGS